MGVSAQLATVAVRQLVHSSAYFQPQRGTLLFVSAQLATVAVCQLVHSLAYFKPQRDTLLVVSAQLATGDGVPLTRDAFRKDSGALLAHMRPMSQPRKLGICRQAGGSGPAQSFKFLLH